MAALALGLIKLASTASSSSTDSAGSFTVVWNGSSTNGLCPWLCITLTLSLTIYSTFELQDVRTHLLLEYSNVFHYVESSSYATHFLFAF